MKKIFSLLLLVTVSTIFLASLPVQGQGLFFSEYVEGSSNNKAVEIYNNTGATVDLAASNVTVEIYSNGHTYVGSTISLSGTVADKGVFVLANSNAGTTVLAAADQTSGSLNFNGDDAVVLKVNGIVADCIGQVGYDPGSEWGSGDCSTKDNTIRRKSTVCTGDTNTGDAFDPSIEWNGYPKDTFDGLGSHTANCSGNAPVIVNCDSPFNTLEGVGGTHQVSASDADGTIASITITDISPALTAGTITIGNFTAGDPATADVTVSTDVPAGQYSVEITGTNNDSTPQTGTCTLTVNVGTGWIINEFLADPTPGADANNDGTVSYSQDEFVEIVNATGFDTDISGWTLSDGNQVRHTFPAGTVIANGCAIVIFGGGSPVGSFGGATVQTASTGTLSLNNSGDSIILEAGNSVMASVTYSSSTDGVSATLSPDINGASYVDHDTAAGSNGAVDSPGTMVDGTPFCTASGAPVIVDCNGNMNAFVGIGGTHAVSASDADNKVISMTISVTPAPASGSITLENFAASAGIGDDATADVVVSSDVPEGIYTVSVMAANDDIPVHAGRCYLTVSVISPKPIHDLQGNGLHSPYDGSGVYTQHNIVTAVGAHGFYMQAPDADADSDPDTSEGIYVYTGGSPTVAVGDMVDVNGTLQEYFDFTEISGHPDVTVTSSGNPLPTAVELDATNPSPDQPQTGLELERYEGMRVHIASGTIDSGTDNYGNVLITAASTRSFREPGILYPGESGLPVWDGDPEIFEMDPDALGLPDQIFHGGTPFTATGIIGYSYGEYQLQPTALTTTPSNYPAPVPDRQIGEFTIATQNMYRLFNDQDDGHTAYGEPILSPQEYADRLTKASRLIREILKSPDILGMQEVETIGVLQDLAAQIHSDDPSVNYTPYLIEGNDIGGIDIGIMVRDDIQVNSVTQVEPNATFNYNNHDYTLHDRPPLLLDAVYTGYGENFPIKVLVVHNRSLLGIDGSHAGFVKEKRWQQAEHIAQYIQSLQNSDPNIRLVVMGDFNAYEFTDGYVDCVGIIKGNLDTLGAELPGIDYVNPDLTDQMLNVAASNRYSYVHDGIAQDIDHILTSQQMNGFVDAIVPARANCDGAAIYDNDPSTPETYSDHDGLVLFVRDLNAVHLAVNFTAATGGTISGNANQQVLYGHNSIAVTAVPNTGKTFTGWTGDYIGTDNPLVLTNVTTDMDITANFTIQTFTITASAGAHGQVNPAGTINVNYGETRAFIFTPDAGYHVSDVIVDGTSVGAAGHYTFSNISATHTLSVSFSANIPPVIDSFTADGTSGNAPLMVNFTCMAHDPDGGGIVRYIWNITGRRADTMVTSAGTLAYRFIIPGDYQVSVTVTDDEGETATAFLPDNGSGSAINVALSEPMTIPLRLIQISQALKDGSAAIQTTAVNEFDENANVTLNAKDAEGNTLGTATVTVPAKGSAILASDSFNNLSYDRIEATADRHLLLFSRVGSDTAKMTAYLSTLPESPLFISHIAEETDYWSSFAYLSDSNPLMLDVTVAGQTESKTAVPAESIDLNALLPQDADTANAWGKLTAYATDPFSNINSLSGFEMFVKDGGDGAACELTGRGSTTLFIPHVPEETDIFWRTGFALLNTGSSPAMVTATFYDDNGNAVGSESLTIPANSKIKGLMTDLFPSEAGKARWGVMESDQVITGIEIYGTYNAGICGMALPAAAHTWGVLPDDRRKQLDRYCHYQHQ
ncbi:MAG: hypothetical protein GXO69_06905 [Acidobacteria bacterium]|nr:hypothetical protein [Acidobacteriota bacterium]